MANPSTATPPPASTVVDEAVRIAAEGSRRTTETAQAAFQASRRYFDQAAELNRDFFALWTSTAEAGLQTAFEVQNATLTSSQAWLETAARLNQDALRRWSEAARQAQATTLKAYQSNARLAENLTVSA